MLPSLDPPAQRAGHRHTSSAHHLQNPNTTNTIVKTQTCNIPLSLGDGRSDRQADRQADQQKYSTDRPTDRQTDRQDRQTDRQAGRQEGRQAGRQTDQ